MSDNRKHSIDFSEEKSHTKQSFKDECDINNIMAKYQRTGVLEHMAKNPPTYGDFESVGDYQDACNKVIAAQSAFDALPAAIRDRMHNSPAEFMAFMHDANNIEEARELGLLMKAAPAPAPAKGPGTQGATASEAGPKDPTSPSPASLISEGE